MIQFVLAVLALLLTPGPTNTLLAVSGASAGLRRSLPLVVAEISGYLSVIVPLVTFAAPWLQAWPAVAIAIKLCSASWVLLLAFRLWTVESETAAGGGVTFLRVYVTTVLNPKALIIALVVMPSGDFMTLAPWLAAFSVSVVCVALVWLTAGAVLIGGASRKAPAIIRRVAAGFLVVFSAGLAGTTLGVL